MGTFMIWILFAMLGLLSWVYVMIYAIVALGLGALAFGLGRGEGQ